MIFHAEGTSPGVSSSTISTSGAISSSIISNSISSAEFAVKMHWATAAMARLGWLVTPSTLLYGTGGVTYAGFGDGFKMFHEILRRIAELRPQPPPALA
jgi:opacity protein-like surface antigen